MSAENSDRQSEFRDGHPPLYALGVNWAEPLQGAAGDFLAITDPKFVGVMQPEATVIPIQPTARHLGEMARERDATGFQRILDIFRRPGGILDAAGGQELAEATSREGSPDHSLTSRLSIANGALSEDQMAALWAPRQEPAPNPALKGIRAQIAERTNQANGQILRELLAEETVSADEWLLIVRLAVHTQAGQEVCLAGECQAFAVEGNDHCGPDILQHVPPAPTETEEEDQTPPEVLALQLAALLLQYDQGELRTQPDYEELLGLLGKVPLEEGTDGCAEVTCERIAIEGMADCSVHLHYKLVAGWLSFIDKAEAAQDAHENGEQAA